MLRHILEARRRVAWMLSAMLCVGGGGESALAAFGPALSRVNGITGDGTNLWLMLEQELDAHGDRAKPARIVRMNPTSGALQDIVELDMASGEPGVGIGGFTVNAGRIYWTETLTTTRWSSTLWSVRADGSSPPTKRFTTLDEPLSLALDAASGDLFLGLYCRVSFSESRLGGHSHIMRMRSAQPTNR